MFYTNQARLISLSHHIGISSMMGLRYQEYIGTLRYSTRLKLCGQWLNSSEGRNSAAYRQILANIGEVGHSRIYLGDRCFIHLLKNDNP